MRDKDGLVFEQTHTQYYRIRRIKPEARQENPSCSAWGEDRNFRGACCKSSLHDANSF